MLVALVWWPDAFRAHGRPELAAAASVFVPVYLLAVGVFGFVSLLTERDTSTPDLTFGGMLETTFGGLIGLDGPYTSSTGSSATSSATRCSCSASSG